MKRWMILALALLLLNSAVAESWVVCYRKPEEYYSNLYLISDAGVIAGGDEYSNIVELFPYGYTGELRRYAVSRQSILLSSDDYDAVFEGDFLETSPGSEQSGPDLPQAMMDERGNLLTGFDYLFLYGEVYPEVGLYVAESEAGLAVLRADGTVAVEGDYKDILPDGGDGFLALRNDRLLHIDAAGTETDVGLGVRALFNESLETDTVVAILNDEKQTKLLLDLQGRPRTEEHFDRIGKSKGGYRFVETLDGRQTYIAADGRHVISEAYDSICQLGESARFLGVRQKQDIVEFTLVDADSGETLLTQTLRGGDVNAAEPTLEENGELFAIWNHVYDGRDGRLLGTLPFGFTLSDIVKIHEEGWRLVARATMAGEMRKFLLDESCAILSPGFSELRCDRYGTSPYWITQQTRTYVDAEQNPQTESRRGVMDSTGKVLLEAEYENLEFLSLELFSVEQDGKTGILRVDGSWLLEPKYDDVEALTANLIKVTVNDRVGILTAAGRWVLAPVVREVEQYDIYDLMLICALSEDRVWVPTTTGFGLMDGKGNWLFRSEYAFLVD